ncbi:unnamed protein product [Paramecium octaurelia]|uniref:Uncharacterized protein n=1 Tax=Paramecium octaurelia TaxID=43137 RepID=A0A8S1WQ54_PAROT|nr:unnamed protein product [Paramecium octaurelia]
MLQQNQGHFTQHQLFRQQQPQTQDKHQFCKVPQHFLQLLAQGVQILWTLPYPSIHSAKHSFQQQAKGKLQDKQFYDNNPQQVLQMGWQGEHKLPILLLQYPSGHQLQHKLLLFNLQQPLAQSKQFQVQSIHEEHPFQHCRHTSPSLQNPLKQVNLHSPLIMFFTFNTSPGLQDKQLTLVLLSHVLHEGSHKQHYRAQKFPQQPSSHIIQHSFLLAIQQYPSKHCQHVNEIHFQQLFMQGAHAVPEKYSPSTQIKHCEFNNIPEGMQSVQVVADVSHFKQFESQIVHFGSVGTLLSQKYPSGHCYTHQLVLLLKYPL